MSNSSLAKEKYPAYSGNYTKGRNTKITEICIHHMAGVLSAKQCGALFQTKGRNGSSNYGIGVNGEIAVYVDECNTAWCNSNWASNCRSVSIETSNNKIGGNWSVSNASLNSLIKLVADIAKRNNMGTLVKGKNVTWHSMYTATACPGQYLLSKMDYIVSEANKINKTPTPTPKPTPSSFLPKRGYWKYGDSSKEIGKICKFYADKFYGYFCKNKTEAHKLLDGDYFGKNCLKWTKEFQKRCKQEGLYNDKIDGNIGPKTIQCLKRFGFKE